MDDLVEALVETGATLGFDATEEESWLAKY